MSIMMEAMYEKHLRPIITDLNKNGGPTELWLDRDSIVPLLFNDTYMDEFCESIRAATNIEAVYFIFFDFGAGELYYELPRHTLDELSYLGRALGTLPALKKLEVGHPSGDVLLFTANILEHTRQISSLDCSSIDCGYYDRPHYDFSIKDVDRLERAIRGHPSLETVKLELCAQSGYTKTCLYRAISSLPRLGHLTFDVHSESACREGSNYLGDLLRKESLEEVTLASSFNSNEVEAISESFRTGSKLRVLTFKKCHINTGGNALARALGTSNHLTCLTFDSCEIEGSFLSILGNDALATNTVLETLHFTGCSGLWHDTPDEQPSAFFRGLESNQTLQSLEIPVVRWRPQLARSICHSLSNNTGLHMFSIGGNNIGEPMSDKSWSELVPFLEHNSTLQEFDACVGTLSEVVLSSTAQGLAHNQHLKSFNLNVYPSITGEPSEPAGVFGFSRALVTNKTLTLCSITINFASTFQCLRPEYAHYVPQCSDAVAQEFVKELEGNYTLEDGNFHMLPGDYRKSVRDIQRLNKAGRRYLLEDPGSKEKAVNVLNEVKDSIDCLFFHLRENPSICFIANDTDGEDNVGPPPTKKLKAT